MKFNNSRRPNAASNRQLDEIEAAECRNIRLEEFRKRALSRPLDPWHDVREPVLSLRLPIVPLSSSSDLPVFDGRDQRSRIQVCVESIDPEAPVATRTQFDVIVWATSELTRYKNLNMKLPTHLDAKVGDILKFIGRQEGGTQCRWLRAALRACSNTSVEVTNFGLDTQHKRFQLLGGVELLGSGEVRVHLDPWLAEEVAWQRIVHISPEAFALGPLQRRLYSYAKSNLGRREGVGVRTISFWDAYDRSGSSDAPRKFRAAVSKLERSQNLPGVFVRCIGKGPRMEIGFSKGDYWLPAARKEPSDSPYVTILDLGDEPGPPEEPSHTEVWL